MEQETKERKRITRKKLVLAIFGLVLATIFAILLKNVLQNRIQAWDNRICQFVIEQRREPITSIFKVLTNLGGASFLIVITLILFCVLKNKKYSVSMAINLVGVALLNQILKFMIQRPRPDEMVRIIPESGFSFPSGHSMASMAFYSLLIYFAYTKIKNVRLKWITCMLLAIVIGVIGMSRIYLGVHYASDVLAGYCLSMLYVILFIQWGMPKILK